MFFLLLRGSSVASFGSSLSSLFSLSFVQFILLIWWVYNLFFLHTADGPLYDSTAYTEVNIKCGQNYYVPDEFVRLIQTVNSLN